MRLPALDDHRALECQLRRLHYRDRPDSGASHGLAILIHDLVGTAADPRGLVHAVTDIAAATGAIDRISLFPVGECHWVFGDTADERANTSRPQADSIMIRPFPNDNGRPLNPRDLSRYCQAAVRHDRETPPLRTGSQGRTVPQLHFTSGQRARA